MSLVRRAALVAASLLVAATLAAQQPAATSASWILFVGADTLAVEQATRTATSLAGELTDRLHGIREGYALSLGADGRVERIDLRVYRPASDTTVRQRATIVLRGDSAFVSAESAGSPPQRLVTRAGAIPYVNPSVALLHFVGAHRRAGASVDTVLFFQTTGGMTTPMIVSWRTADSADVSLGGIQGSVVMDADGWPRRFVVPAQRFRGERSTTRVSLAPHASYDAPLGAPYTAEEVTVRTPAGLALAGTLTLPTTRPARGVPAVVTITGSGQQDRDESIPLVNGYRPFRQLADTLARRGIAVLRLDDRGVGGSDPGRPDATSADFADDVRAALAYLRTRPEIDHARLALVGHSEGGLIAPMVAATDSALRGIVLLAGPAQTGRRILDYQSRWAIDRDTSLTTTKRDSLYRAIPASIDSAARRSAWVRWFLDYDPLATARRVRVPVLVLQGATDRQVTAEQAEALGAALRAGGNRRVTVRVFPETNHLFVPDPAGDPAHYAALTDARVRPAVLGAIADWLVAAMR